MPSGDCGLFCYFTAMQKAAVIVAGGSGTRMESKVPKQFLPLGNMPIIFRTVKRFLAFDSSLLVVLVLPADNQEDWNGLTHLYLSDSEKSRITLQAGGNTRTLSVEGGLKVLAAQVDPAQTLVAIHDGVRPLITDDVINKAFAAAKEFGAAVSCIPVKSSMREEIAPGQSQPVDRSKYWHVQTPQSFRLEKILKAFSIREHDNFTDDASLYQAYIGKVAICEGSYDNLKVTTPEDLFVADALLRRQESQV